MTKTPKVHVQVWLALTLCSIILVLGSKGMHIRADPLAPPPGLAIPRQATPMPDFSLPDVDGATMHAADLQGKVIVVRFWATWWPICTGEMPSVQRVHEALQDKDVVVLAISIDGGGIQTVKSHVIQHGYTMPVLVDKGMEVARKFGARAVPMTYIVNRQGMAVASGFGPVDFDRPEFREYLQTLVAQPRG